MRVKIGKKWYDSEDVPIMLELGEEDKECIENMRSTATKFCSYPEGMMMDAVMKFMEIDEGTRIEKPEGVQGIMGCEVSRKE